MIAKQDLDQLMNQLRVKLVGASDAGMKAQLYDVCTEFFKDTLSWYEVVQFTGQPAVLDYAITPSEGQIIQLAVVVNADSSPISASMFEMGVVHLAAAPNESQPLYATVIKNVTLPNTRDMTPIAPDWLLPQWHLEIQSGVLGNMMLQPDKSYTDKATALYHLKRFRDGIAQARARTLRANTQGTQAWQFPRSFSTGAQRGGSGSERQF